MNNISLGNWLQFRDQSRQTSPPQQPTLGDWMSASRQELAEVVRHSKITLFVPSDGTRRYFLMRQMDQQSSIPKVHDYLAAMGSHLMGLFRLLFSHGITNIVCSVLEGPNFDRGSEYVRATAAAASAVLTGEAFTRFSGEWNVEMGLYGGWDVLPSGEPGREILKAMSNRFANINSQGDRKIIFGFCPDSFVDEMCARSEIFRRQTGHSPDSEQLRHACFPKGPDRLDLIINFDMMRAGRLVPPVLDFGTHYYHLSYFPYDLSEMNLRQILYDYLFVRNPEPFEGQNYSQAELREIQSHDTQNKNRVIGLGKRLTSGLWQIQ